jgi:hypothetical protein
VHPPFFISLISQANHGGFKVLSVDATVSEPLIYHLLDPADTFLRQGILPISPLFRPESSFWPLSMPPCACHSLLTAQASSSSRGSPPTTSSSARSVFNPATMRTSFGAPPPPPARPYPEGAASAARTVTPPTTAASLHLFSPQTVHPPPPAGCRLLKSNQGMKARSFTRRK